LKSQEQTTAEGPKSESAPETASHFAAQPALLRLSRTLGNQAVLRYLQRKGSCGGTCDACQNHALPIGPDDDRHEREADLAGQHVRPGEVLQRKCSHCKEEEEEDRVRKLQRQETAD